jgi:hypothetical protein
LTTSSLADLDLDRRRGSPLAASPQAGRRAGVGVDEWGWEQLRPWLAARAELPAEPLFCIIDAAPVDERGRQPQRAPSSGGLPSERGE